MIKNEVSFEEAIKKLEETVSELENGDVSLEEMLKRFEEGITLVKVCHEKLNISEKKIEELTQSINGKIYLKNIEGVEE